jgi:hypothetical protein
MFRLYLVNHTQDVFNYVICTRGWNISKHRDSPPALREKTLDTRPVRDEASTWWRLQLLAFSVNVFIQLLYEWFFHFTSPLVNRTAWLMVGVCVMCALHCNINLPTGTWFTWQYIVFRLSVSIHQCSLFTPTTNIQLATPPPSDSTLTLTITPVISIHHRLLLPATPPPQGTRPVCTSLHNIILYLHTLHIHSPMKMGQTQCSETSAVKHYEPGSNPKD